MIYLHEGKKRSKEEERGPFYLVQYTFQVSDVSKNQQPQRSKNGDPPYRSKT